MGNEEKNENIVDKSNDVVEKDKIIEQENEMPKENVDNTNLTISKVTISCSTL